jgi:predicted nucleic acid-binding protein
MITAVDSSVLWALFNDEPGSENWSRLLMNASREGGLVICDIVFAEIAPAFASCGEALETLEKLNIRFEPTAGEAAYEAGTVFKAYRREGGPRSHMIPDFLVASHALHQSDRLAAIDRGYLRRYFPNLKLLAI